MPAGTSAGRLTFAADGVLAACAGAATCAGAAGWAGVAARTPTWVALTDCVPAVLPDVLAGGTSLAGRLFCWAAVMKSCSVTVVAPKVSRPAAAR